MPRDYARKKAPAKRKRNAVRRKKTGFPTTAVLVVGMVVGSFVAFLFYLKFIPQITTTHSVADKTGTVIKTPSEKTPSKAVAPEPKAEVPKYTFHERLLHKEVEIPEEDLKLPGNKVSMEYLMPCGAFREPERADALKAEIALLGFETHILPVDNSTGRWYRVQLGPFASKRQAESIRHRLQNNEINDCRINGKRL